MKTYFIGERIAEFETDSLKAAKAWVSQGARERKVVFE